MNIWINFTSVETGMIVYLMLKTAGSYLYLSGQNTGMCRKDGQNPSS